MRLLNGRERKTVSKERNTREAPGIKVEDPTIFKKKQPKEAPGIKAKDDGANEATKTTTSTPKTSNTRFTSRSRKSPTTLRSESREPGSSHSRAVRGASTHSRTVADSHTPAATHSRSAHARIAILKVDEKPASMDARTNAEANVEPSSTQSTSAHAKMMRSKEDDKPASTHSRTIRSRATDKPESIPSIGRSKPRVSPSPGYGSKHERLLDDEDAPRGRSMPRSRSRSRSQIIPKKLPIPLPLEYMAPSVLSEESLLNDEDAPPRRSMPRSRSRQRPRSRSIPKKLPMPLEYMPPSASEDSDDKLTKVDKYRTALAIAESSSLVKDCPLDMERRFPSIVPTTFQPPAMQTALKVGQEQMKTNLSAMTSPSFGTTTSDYSTLMPPSRTRRSRRDTESVTTSDSRYFGHEDGTYSDDDFNYGTKQNTAYACLVLSAVQLGILVIQMVLCGVATVDINPMIGPYPDAFSEWGGKNPYLMLEGEQYFRIITPVLLHVGLLHLLVNVFVQLETCAFFEKEWGTGELVILYLISGVGSVATCSVTSPDIISVSSSGALMGLFGAKFAQVLGWTCFDVHGDKYYDAIHLDKLGGVMCSTALISMLSLFTYIDWAGHMGGLGAGFLGGMWLFCKPIENLCVRILWGGTGLLGLVGGAASLGYLMMYELNPDEDLADACEYFRNLYPEGYDCECAWN